MHGVEFTGCYRKGNCDSTETGTNKNFDYTVDLTFLRDIPVSIELNIDRNSKTEFTGNCRIGNS